MPIVRFGTSSWSEKSWVGSFYPPGTKAGDMLARYATQFDTVEADTTYYRRPSFDLTRRWAAVTPPGFLLSSKMPLECYLGDDPRELDPARILQGQTFEAALGAHSAALSLLGDKCGPVVIQFPWIRREVFADLAAFLDRLDPFLGSLGRSHRWAVEVRNREYLHDELLAVLRRHRVALTLSEVRGMPHPADVAEKLDVLTTGWFYARLIGDRTKLDRLTKDRSPAAKFGSVALDQSASLGRWAHLIRTLASTADGFAYANNHYEGHGPATIQRLRETIAAGC